MRPVDLLLALAAVAVAVALLYPRASRWAWLNAAAAAAAWIALSAGLAAGGLLLAGVAVATRIEGPQAVPAEGFNDLVARLGCLLAGMAGALVLVVRVLGADPSTLLAVALMAAMGIATLLHLLTQAARPESSRAIRLAIVIAVAGWTAGGHPGLSTPAAAALALVVVAAIPRLLEAS